MLVLFQGLQGEPVSTSLSIYHLNLWYLCQSKLFAAPEF